MNFSLAYVKNTNQVLLKNFMSSQSDTPHKSAIMEIEELKNHEAKVILVPEEYVSNDEVFQKLSPEVKFAPIKKSEQLNIDSDQFDSLDYESAQNIYEKTYQSWVLQNNLNLIGNMFEVTDRMKALWPNDRTSFFEELWFLLKNNLGATNLKVFFNHMIKAKKEGEKNQLTRIKVEGDKIPNPSDAGELGKSLMENFQGRFTSPFDIVEHEDSGKFVFLASINQSPVVIMGEAKVLTPLQKQIMKSVFTGFQADR
ncbi:MAG: hypothetical protein GY909_04015 [Oligoflexia bacterium]|nr:hypothetical protein [Oligoflexia bacterium]